MKNNRIEFKEIDHKEVEIYVNGIRNGVLKFDDEDEVWYLWPENLDDAVAYLEDLQETKDVVLSELMHDED